MENLKVKKLMKKLKVINDRSSHLDDMNKQYICQTLLKLPSDIREIALAMLNIGEGTADEIADEVGIPVDEVLKKISALQKLGYIGLIQKEGKTVYFTSGKE